MTWYFDPHGKTMDVFDHDGDLVAENEPITYDDDGNIMGKWVGAFPDRVKTIAHDHMEGNQPSAYNQQLIADMACDQIKQGTPDQ